MPIRHLFIDWSGDLGFKFGRGSTTHLVIVVVSIADYGGFRKFMADLRTERGLYKAYEFHHAHIPKTERAAFFDALPRAGFKAWVLVVDKRRLPENFKRRDQYDLLGEFIAVLADQLPAEAVENALVLIDAHTTTTELTRSIRVAISRALRARQTQPRIKEGAWTPCTS